VDITTMPWGPDVSHYHPVKDWEAFNRSGATFFAAKATEGEHAVDQKFEYHREGYRTYCSSFTVCVWYHFFRMDRDPVNQAEHLVESVGDLGTAETLCCDFEGGSYDKIAPSLVRANGLKFLDSFYRRLLSLGLLYADRPLLYTSYRHWEAIGNPTWDLASDVDLWVPRYNAVPQPPDKLPKPWIDWKVLQYTDGDAGVHKNVDGVGLCDCNVFKP
jgi:GH25 family lysozyme M1 (1,4-beta-N-acetylmuramidase)